MEYGRDEVIGSYRTEYMSSHLVSVKILLNFKARNNERPYIVNGIRSESNRKIAYLLDMYTIRIVDIDTTNTLSMINHPIPVFTELNIDRFYRIELKMHIFSL